MAACTRFSASRDCMRKCFGEQRQSDKLMLSGHCADSKRASHGRRLPLRLIPRGSVKIPRVWSLETPPLDNRGQRR